MAKSPSLIVAANTGASGDRPQLGLLTSLRFFAALQVLGYHLSLDAKDTWVSATELVKAFFSNGLQAVHFFFVLSGFVLTYAHQAKQSSSPSSINPRSFYLARFARIYPAYALALVISLPSFVYSALVAKIISMGSLYAGLMLVPLLAQSWIPPFAGAWTFPAWSLSVEAFFYLLFPFLIAHARRVRPVVLLLLSSLALMLASLARHVILDSSDWIPSAQIRLNLATYFPLFSLPHFVLGMALCRCVSLAHLKEHAASIVFHVTLATIITLFTLRSSAPDWVLSELVFVSLFGLAIASASRATGFIPKLLSSNSLVQMGESSYALYILHGPLAFWWKRAEAALGLHPFGSWASVSAFILVALGVAYLAHTKYERPMRVWILNQAGRLATSPSSVSKTTLSH
jgi:peptidoglycan/LPS O-acetylase OafA/YrhL